MLVFKRLRKKAMELQLIGWLVLGAAVLALVIVAIVYARMHATSALSYIKSIFRLGVK